MRKIKVLQFPIAQSRSGITHYAMRNWEFIDKSRFQFDFATLSKTLSFEDELTRQGCKVHYISKYAEEDPEAFSEEFRNILKEGYDAVHLHTGYWKSFLAENEAKAAGVPVIIVHAHSTMIAIDNDMEREKAIKIHNEQKQLFSADLATHFLACADKAADWLFGSQIPREKIRVLKNAINTEKFAFYAETRNSYRQKLGFDNNDFIIGDVAKFTYQKNHHFLLEVFDKVHKYITNAKLLLIGDGELQDEVKELVKKYALTDQVRFMGSQPDMEIPKLYQAMDLFCTPARFGGLDLVLVEAQTSGLKCLTSDAMPSECKITDNLVYLPLELTAWRNAIVDIAQNSYERRDRSAEVASAGYSLKEQITVLEKIYTGKEQQMKNSQ